MRAWLLALWIAAPAWAQPYASDWQAAMVSDNPRFQLFALMQARPIGADQAVAELQRGQGLAGWESAGQVVQSSLNLTPLIGYDPNINGGTPGKTIVIGGLLFDIDPDSQAKAGLTAGGRISGNLGWTVAPQTVVLANLSGNIARGAGLTVAGAGGSLCLGRYLGGADWLDLCGTANRTDRALTDTSDTSLSLGLTHGFATDFGLFQTDATLRQTRTRQDDQLSLDFGAMVARGRMGLITARISLGQWVPGQHRRQFLAHLSLTRPVLGQDTQIYAQYQREAGSQFFGLRRQDDTISLGLSRPLGDHLTLGLALHDRRSNLANYDGVTLGLEITLRDIRL